MPHKITLEDILDSKDDGIYDITTDAEGPKGKLPLTEDFLVDAPSGDIFGMSQNAGMGWKSSKLNQEQFLLLSTQGGIRAGDGTPVALGYHIGHFELGLLAGAAAQQLQNLGYMPFAAFPQTGPIYNRQYWKGASAKYHSQYAGRRRKGFGLVQRVVLRRVEHRAVLRLVPTIGD